jgi:hypothetical protein
MRRLLILSIIGLAPAHAAADFDRDVRPILSDNCFSCHGPDSTKRMANLRLDTLDGGAFANSIIVPGDSSASHLYQRISATDGMRMPPSYSGHTLTPPQIEAVKQWIDSGAKWQKHWAFQAPVRPDPAMPKEQGWARNPIDRFVLAKLEQEGLKHSPEADKSTLLRRVTYDLTGLPPTIEEINAFLADKSPDAYEKRVDALLASPRYGERMAVPWLDLARYADTHGYHIDSHREMWHWRDWVVEALNRNLPYDQFTIWQIAGDLLPNATLEQKLASGFNRNHMINFEGGAIPEEYQVEYVVDRVEATSTAFMGLTMGCARCHDHKYDPIPQKDFYRFFAFFNNVSEKGLDGRSGNAEPFLQLPSDEQKARETRLKLAIAAHEKALPEEAVAKSQAEWEQQALARFQALAREGLSAHYEFDGSLADSSGHYRYGRIVHGDLTYSNGTVDRGADFDGETHAVFGPVAALDNSKPFSIAFWLKVNNKPREPLFRQAGAIEAWLDDFELSGVQQRVPRLYIRMGGKTIRTQNRLPWPDNMNHIVLNHDAAGNLAIFVNGQPVQFEPNSAEPPATDNSNPIFEIDGFKGKIDDLRIYSRALTTEEIAYLTSLEPLRAVLNILPDKRSKDQKAWIRNYYLTHAAPAEDQKTWAELKTLQADEKKLTAEIPTTMVMSEITDKPRETFILARGDYRNQTEKVTPGVPSILPPLPDGAPANRLSLAKWLVDPQNPLTARVAVNRYWQMYFGTGIVKTAENFGAQGDPPANQPLLDWLATEFIRTGWDVKAMQRLVVTSAAYRQSSKVTPELLEKDPDNQLIARGPRFRLSAEMIRDGDLYLSGLLKDQQGGAPVNPYQPKGVWEEIAFGDGFTAQSYEQGHGDDLHRRSLYTFWKRTAPAPEMITFDAPSREKCTARRTITNTPLQALVLLNDVTYVEAARSLAERIMTEGGKTPAGRIEFAFKAATAREAKPKELAILRDAFNAQLLEYKRHEDKAAALLKNGEAPVNLKLDKSELAAWTTIASMILNLDEAMTKQ